MKAPILCISAVLVASSLFTSKASAVNFAVRGDSGTQCYSLEVSGGITPKPGAMNDPDVAYSKLTTVNAGSAELAAVAWAGGLNDFEKPVGGSAYPNSLSNLGAKSGGGFYNATYVHPTHVERVQGPTPYYLVTMSGVTSGGHQTLYAAVLDDGRIVPPTSVPCSERHAPARRHHPMRKHHHP